MEPFEVKCLDYDVVTGALKWRFYTVQHRSRASRTRHPELAMDDKNWITQHRPVQTAAERVGRFAYDPDLGTGLFAPRTRSV